MAEVTPHMLANSIMGKIYDVLTNGDETVPKSENSFFSWCTPGIAVTPEDFEFLTQGFTGVVKKAAVAELTGDPGAGENKEKPPATENKETAPAATQPTAPDKEPAPAPETAPAEKAAPAAKESGLAATEAADLTQAQMDQLRASDATKMYQQAEAFARLVDFVPDVTRINNDQFAKFAVMNDQGTLSEIYERTLRFSQVMQSSLTEDEKQKLARFRSLLVATTEKEDLISGQKIQVSGPSPLVSVYNEKMAAYENAALEYNARRIDALTAENQKAVHFWAMNANILRNRVKAAMADWIGTGHKSDFEQIAAFIAQVEGRDLTLLKQTYLDDLEKAKLTGLASGSEFFYTALVPANFAKSKGWTQFTFSSTDYKRHSDSHFKSSGWEAKATGGFFGIGASGGHKQDQSKTEFNGTFESNNFSLSFEITQVPIVRAWMKRSYLSSKTWRFDQQNVDLKDEVLSDGGSPPKGLMPAIPTSVIFVRNLVLNFGKNTGFSKFLDEQKSSKSTASASIGWGSFSFGGGGSRFSKSHDTSSDSGFTHTSEGMKIPGMQIIGFKCQVLSKKSPSPAPGIKDWV